VADHQRQLPAAERRNHPPSVVLSEHKTDKERHEQEAMQHTQYVSYATKGGGLSIGITNLPALQLTSLSSARMVGGDMLTFIQFLEDLTADTAVLHASEVERMRSRFGDKVLQMGRLNDNGSMSISVESIVEAAQSLGNRKLNEAVRRLKSDEMAPML